MNLDSLELVLSSMICGLLFAFLVVVIVGYLILNARWENTWKQQIQAVAAQRGWAFHLSPDSRFDFVLDGAEGDLPWELTYWRRKTRGNTRTTPMDYAAVWKTNTPSNESVLIYPRIPSLPANVTLDSNGMGGMALQFMMGQLGVDISGMTFQSIGSTVFKEKYMVLARSAETARKVLFGQVEHQLVNWPYVRDFARLPSIHIDGESVTVNARRDMSFGEIFGDQRMNYERELPDRLVHLGVDVVNALRNS